MNSADRSVPRLSGGCQCGAIRYALYDWPRTPHVCHCRMCQKAVGAPFAAFAEVALDAFEWSRGKPAWFRSSEAVERGFCPACGTSLHFRYVDGPHIDIALATLDHPDTVEPRQQFGMESRLSWIERLGELPGSTTEGSTPADALARYRSRQHPDFET